mmetsp:Transcript_40662/g.112941  ORF Transcript_40662/g.112941 Transcript_40662/m.112941 type:complete len:208 (-) Transcript_40662:213-836(-)
MSVAPRQPDERKDVHAAVHAVQHCDEARVPNDHTEDEPDSGDERHLSHDGKCAQLGEGLPGNPGDGERVDGLQLPARQLRWVGLEEDACREDHASRQRIPPLQKAAHVGADSRAPDAFAVHPTETLRQVGPQHRGQNQGEVPEALQAPRAAQLLDLRLQGIAHGASPRSKDMAQLVHPSGRGVRECPHHGEHRGCAHFGQPSQAASA